MPAHGTTDQKVEGSSPSERASQVIASEATCDHEVAFSVADTVAKAAHVKSQTARLSRPEQVVSISTGFAVPVMQAQAYYSLVKIMVGFLSRAGGESSGRATKPRPPPHG